MKKLFTLTAVALLTWVAVAPVAAAPPMLPATANFISERGQVFSLALDGQPLTRPVARQVHVARLVPGQHWADFSVPTRYGPPLRFRTAVWLAPGLETSYILVLRPGYGPQLRQLGAVPLGRPGYGPQGNYGGYQQGYPQPQQAPSPYSNAPGGYDDELGPPPASPAPPYGSQRPADGRYQSPPPPNGTYDAGQAGGYNSPTTPAPTPPYPGTYPPRGNAPTPGNDGYYPNGTPAPNTGGYNDPNSPSGNYLEPLSPTDVQDLTQDLRDEPSDETRLNLAKEALAKNSVQAADLAQLMGTLKLSKSRTELAKYGYSHVSDPQNFSRVYDVLRSPASIQEVQQSLGLPQN
jgi:hypothetical protein